MTAAPLLIYAFEKEKHNIINMIRPTAIMEVMIALDKGIGLVCDATADFPEGLAESLGLHILPVHIVVHAED